MKRYFRQLLFSLVFAPCVFAAQTTGLKEFKPDPVKVQMYMPYIQAKHGGPSGTEQWKQQNLLKYQGEIWYYTESFSIKSEHIANGEKIDESIIDISRFEHLRQKLSDTVVVIPGYRDGLLLIATSKLLYNPGEQK